MASPSDMSATTHAPLPSRSRAITRPVAGLVHPQPAANDSNSRLVIVSNRVANLRGSAQTGGLAVALADAMRERGGVWFGWDGEREGETGGTVTVETIGKVERVAAPLSPEDWADFYLGYSNSVLWPLFHYRLDLVDYKPAYFEAYQRVNDSFARQLRPFLRADDTIWVHDYHLIPLARALRRLGVRQKIGFFLHIPFPPPDMLAASPNHAELVEALLEYDLLGFQTHTDANNLRRYLTDHTGAMDDGAGHFTIEGRRVQIARFPIGIDADGFAALSRRADDDVAFDVMRRNLLGRKQIIGVDRLDYSKGLPERLKAYGQLLEDHPELDKAVTFLQIAPPTREEVDAYGDIRVELETLAGSINGRFADFNWTPVHYIHRAVPRTKLAALYRGSEVGFVSPLRDGMNLVAKEYVAAQDPEDPGVLILSQFAGAAEEMTAALIVNPYDIHDMAAQLHRALTMPLEERRDRHAVLLAHVSAHTAATWLTAFLAALDAPPTPQRDDEARETLP